MKQLQATLYGFAIRATGFSAVKLPARQKGATAIEYAIIAAVMVVAVAAAFLVLGEGIEDFFVNTVLPALENPGGSD